MQKPIIRRPAGVLLGTDGDYNTYEFRCQECREHGLIFVPVEGTHNPFLCPTCGAKYIQFHPDSSLTPQFLRVKGDEGQMIRVDWRTRTRPG